jgi:hypothetical protein
MRLGHRAMVLGADALEAVAPSAQCLSMPAVCFIKSIRGRKFVSLTIFAIFVGASASFPRSQVS